MFAEEHARHVEHRGREGECAERRRRLAAAQRRGRASWRRRRRSSSVTASSRRGSPTSRRGGRLARCLLPLLHLEGGAVPGGRRAPGGTAHRAARRSRAGACPRRLAEGTHPEGEPALPPAVPRGSADHGGHRAGVALRRARERRADGAPASLRGSFGTGDPEVAGRRHRRSRRSIRRSPPMRSARWSRASPSCGSSRATATTTSTTSSSSSR